MLTSMERWFPLPACMILLAILDRLPVADLLPEMAPQYQSTPSPETES
jgi:hypothetical protein